MKRRGIATVFVFIWCFIVIGGRLAHIALGEKYVSAAESQSLYTLTVDIPRGTVYDRGLTPLTNRQQIYKAALTSTPSVISEIHSYFTGEEKENLLDLLARRKPFVAQVPAGFSARGATVFACSEKAPTVQSAIHVIGYLDAAGEKGVSGLQKLYDEALACRQKTVVTYHCDATGGALVGVDGEGTQDGSVRNKGVITTLELTAQLAAESAFSEGRGAIIIQRCGSGEVSAVMSAPTYSPKNLASAMEDPSLPMLNRAFSAYNVGSVFKLCVAAAALEQGIPVNREYTCTGSIEAGEIFHCHKEEGHGALTMEQALAVSCNTYFIDLARTVGGEAVYNMAMKMGFGAKQILCEGMESDAGNLPNLQELTRSPAELANFAIGQGALLATPLQIAAMTNAIADGGIYFPPFLIMGTIDETGRGNYEKSPTGTRIMGSQTADSLKAMMEQVMTTGTGMKGLSVAVSSGGKTATAQTGMVDAEGKGVTQAWFTGYFPAEEPEYIVTVLVEGGAAGGSDAAPIFKAVCEAMVPFQKK